MSAAARGLAIADFDLIYGIGNVGRQDDGLGWAAADRLEVLYPDSAQEYIRHYQLFFEDVALLQEKELVLFIDACKRDVPDPIVPHAVILQDMVHGFAIEPIQAAMDLSFTSHSISLPSIAAMCELCYQNCPEIWLLSIQGYQWELELGLSPQAQKNLDRALHYIGREGVRAVGSPVFSGHSAAQDAVENPVWNTAVSTI